MSARVELLAKVSLFESMSRDDVADLAQGLEERALPRGRTIFERGDAGAKMYLIERGSVQIFLPTEGGPDVLLKTLHPGQYFGELSLFDDKPRSASARAETDVLLLELERNDITRVFERRASAAWAIIREMAERLRETNELLSQRAARDLNRELDEKLTWKDRLADRLAETAGSWTFIVSFLVTMIAWFALNTVQSLWHAVDPFPFTFFNLLLGIVAAFQGPVIMMSQNRQGLRDRARAEVDYAVNLKNEVGIEAIQRDLRDLRDLVRAQASHPARGSTPPVHSVG